jgi:hypothetical protein
MLQLNMVPTNNAKIGKDCAWSSQELMFLFNSLAKTSQGFT